MGSSSGNFKWPWHTCSDGARRETISNSVSLSSRTGGGHESFNNNGAYLLLCRSLSLVLAQVRQQPPQVDGGSVINGDNGTATEELQRRRTPFLQLHGVLWVLPYSYLDVPNKDYGG
ncbi:hypothetical protein PIB30_006427 [Stylosanthes scabra]|uniref:Uncharacterized protein n=1 Tax=Stylosanthes scabra TaxID=79078 RepID=A0ABU6U554_9FABA|nr:hypothetical protein [Stylosanthes scabra]